MTGKECAKGTRRRRGEAEQLAAEFETSGLTRRQFCQRHDVSLNTLARYLNLPPGEAGKVPVWARRLADLAGVRRVEWSDSWPGDDLREATAASFERFEQQEREGS